MYVRTYMHIKLGLCRMHKTVSWSRCLLFQAAAGRAALRITGSAPRWSDATLTRAAGRREGRPQLCPENPPPWCHRRAGLTTQVLESPFRANI